MSSNSNPIKFAHLHQHTAYSLLDGAARIRDLIDWVREVSPEDPALAITDHGNMHGVIEFYRTARKAGVKPIVGFEAYVTAGSRFDKRRPESKLDGGFFHLTLLAKDFEGYQNLCRLNSRAWLEGFYHKPRVDLELLEEYSQGVIALSGCLGAQIPRTLLDAGEEAGRETLKRYLDIYRDNFFLEVQNHDLPEHALLTPPRKRWADEFGIGLVATNDGHYVKRDDARAHEALLAIQTKTTLSNPDRFRFPCDEFYVKTPAEMALAVPESEFPGAIANSMLIADMCNLVLPLGRDKVYQMPVIEVPEERTLAEQLRVQAYEGLQQRYPVLNDRVWRDYLRSATPDLDTDSLEPGEVHLQLARIAEQGRHARQGDENYDRYEYPHLEKFAESCSENDAVTYLRRCEFELGVIIAMGFPDYFLIVADFINWAKNQGIAVGPGRGSGAGSIVAYALRITDIDPLEFDLLFERFLNPDRVSMPDFDIDFSDTRRNEVIDYVREKYGDDKVAHIATFGTMASKAAIRDAARVMEAPYAEADRVSKLIPVVFGRSVSIERALEEVPEMRELYEAGAKPFIDVAQSLEGLTRHASVHAAGIIIARNPVVDLAPVFRSGDGPIVCQYDMGSVEDLGFIKMDFLGLRTLSFIEAAVKIIRESRGVELNPDEFPPEDEATFALLSRGDAAGVFQFEGPGMIDTLRKLRPRRIHDLIAVSALYRPGPMENIPSYIRRHHGEEEISYRDFPEAEELLKPILAETYGIPVYQGQIMQIAQAVAGYSLGQADILRRAMGKKQVDEMNEQRQIFEEGSARKGISKAEAGRIFDLLEKFANYGFNKSHSAAYGVLSYQTAYLKAHFPVEFAAALLTVERANSDKVAEYVADAGYLGIEVLPPDINESRADFTPVGDVVRFGLYGIKNVGELAVDAIIREREKDGPFQDLYDFCKRVDSSALNRRALEHLVKAGAFDGLGDRSTLLANVENAQGWGNAHREQAQQGQMSLFGDEELTPPPLAASERLSELELLRMEKESLGMYISSHPMSSYPGLAETASCSVAQLDGWFRQQEAPAGRGRIRVVLSGLLQRVSKRPTRRGTMMARFEIADESGAREVVAFARAYEAMADLLREDLPVVLIAEASEDDGGVRLVADRLISWEERPPLPEVALLEFREAQLTGERLLELRSVLDEKIGVTPVRFRLATPEGTVTYAPEGICVDTRLLDEVTAECPWLTYSVTLDREQLLAQRSQNTWGGPPEKAIASVDVPF
jgi:DNA polymerase-3 subunit alpha